MVEEQEAHIAVSHSSLVQHSGYATPCSYIILIRWHQCACSRFLSFVPWNAHTRAQSSSMKRKRPILLSFSIECVAMTPARHLERQLSTLTDSVSSQSSYVHFQHARISTIIGDSNNFLSFFFVSPFYQQHNFSSLVIWSIYWGVCMSILKLVLLILNNGRVCLKSVFILNID